VHYFYTFDYAAAAHAFERAAAMPGAPMWLQPLAATTRLQGGNRAGARQMLESLLDSPESYLRNSAVRTLQQIQAMDFIDALQEPIAAFHRAAGRYPSGWPELVRAGLIASVPLDPLGVPLVYDATVHRATVSPESPLFPLPETLVRR
jgi:hypothetical protein